MMNSPLPPTPGPMPSLTANGAMANPTPQAANPQSLQDLMSDGFYLLLLLKRGQLPHDAESFVQTVQKLWDQRVGLQDNEHYFVKLEKDSPRYKDIVAAALEADDDEKLASKMHEALDT